MSQRPTFRHELIWSGEPEERTFLVCGDVDGDGTPEFIIGSRKPVERIYMLDRDAQGRWQEHLVDEGCGRPEAGGYLYDIDGDGRLDLVAGHDASADRILWWQSPADPTQRWRRREIFQMPANKSHEQLVADLDGDGRPEVYFWNQRGEAIFRVPVPDDPTVEPWPNVRPLVEGVNEEGLTVADVDGDGRLELIAGQSWYRPGADPAELWERHVFAEGYVTPKLIAADFDGDGRAEIVLGEGDASYRKDYAYLVYFDQGDRVEDPWEARVLNDRLVDPHSLGVADFDGDGRPDLYAGELGSPKGEHKHPPAQRIYYNTGEGPFEEVVIHQDLAGAHEAKVVRLDGRPVIVGKPYRSVGGAAPRGPEVDGIHLWIPETP